MIKRGGRVIYWRIIWGRVATFDKVVGGDSKWGRMTEGWLVRGTPMSERQIWLKCLCGTGFQRVRSSGELVY